MYENLTGRKLDAQCHSVIFRQNGEPPPYSDDVEGWSYIPALLSRMRDSKHGPKFYAALQTMENPLTPERMFRRALEIVTGPQS